MNRELWGSLFLRPDAAGWKGSGGNITIVTTQRTAPILMEGGKGRTGIHKSKDAAPGVCLHFGCIQPDVVETMLVKAFLGIFWIYAATG
ncbi:hypothetical protein TNIN_60881 [Trichonephila inaurata madagascariensis]|uniref:Uncharacterized protein n=1 Tax=Trichonephila inaurata madagascariensis TaxID=2747483 RepID=A0A8X6X3H8_9ARAC|nr:hypothetical protein TNIN_60881 [Trichonephila inaurata madagascariensis]